jgi:hypothetical protein
MNDTIKMVVRGFVWVGIAFWVRDEDLQAAELVAMLGAFEVIMAGVFDFFRK